MQKKEGAVTQKIISQLQLFHNRFCGHVSRANHTISKERRGDYLAMASSHGMLSEGEKRVEERMGLDWWMVWK